ncbi:unnamed protein product [Amoebophrya sp. A120]|nr:unnamed protein product [Amoebophrya sp. A120]|eukprot:GSA120T00015181001.1
MIYIYITSCLRYKLKLLQRATNSTRESKARLSSCVLWRFHFDLPTMSMLNSFALLFGLCIAGVGPGGPSDCHLVDSAARCVAIYPPRAQRVSHLSVRVVRELQLPQSGGGQISVDDQVRAKRIKDAHATALRF